MAQPAARGGFLPPSMPAHSHRIAPEHDPDRARTLLAEAGYPDKARLPDLELAVASYLRDRRLEEFVAGLVSQWAVLGATVRARIVPVDAMQRTLAETNLWLWAWDADFPDPAGMFAPFLATMPVFRDEQMMQALDRAGSAHDQDERIRLYREVDRLLVAERCSLIPIEYGQTLLLRRPWVQGYDASPLHSFGTTLDHLVVRPERRA